MLVLAELGYNYRLVNLMAEGGDEDALNAVSSFGKWAAAFGFGLFAMQGARALLGPQFDRTFFGLVGYVWGLGLVTLMMRGVVGIFFWALPYFIPEQTKHDAVRVVQIREAGAGGALQHGDLWVERDRTATIAERIARSNIAMLLIGSAWQPLHEVARVKTNDHIHEKTRPDIDKLVQEIDERAAPIRPHYAEYKKANDEADEALASCIAVLTDDTSKVRARDRSALVRLIARLPAKERRAAQKEQQSVYYRHKRTVVRGKDLPLFMTFAEFQAFWEPHVKKRAGTSGFARRIADNKVRSQWQTYSRSMTRLEQQMVEAERKHSAECTNRVAKSFREHKSNERGLEMGLDMRAFVMATVKDEDQQDAQAHLNKVVDAARPAFNMPALHVADLPFLDSEAAVRDALSARIARVEQGMFKPPTEHSDEEVDDVAMAIIGRPLALVLSTLSLVLNLGNALGAAIVWYLRRRYGRCHAAARLLGPVVLVSALALPGSPFVEGGEFDRIYQGLASGEIGSPGRAWAFALQAEPAVWNLGLAVCHVAEWVCPDPQ